MSLREAINRRPAVAKALALSLLFVATALIVYQLRADAGARREPITEAFYSVDDGATYFADDVNKVSGFDHAGRPAYRAYVFRNGDGEPFVGYLERYAPEVRAELVKRTAEAGAAAPGAAGVPARAQTKALVKARQVKKPGDADWVAADDPQVSRVLAIRAPDGGDDDLAPVTP